MNVAHIESNKTFLLVIRHKHLLRFHYLQHSTLNVLLEDPPGGFFVYCSYLDELIQKIKRLSVVSEHKGAPSWDDALTE